MHGDTKLPKSKSKQKLENKEAWKVCQQAQRVNSLFCS